MSSRFRHRRPPLDDVVQRLTQAAMWAQAPRSPVTEQQARRLVGLDDGDLVLAAADRVISAAVARAWDGGWQPIDLWQLAGRFVSEDAAELAVVAVAADAARSSVAAMHPRWRAQLAELDARVSWPADEPFCAAWARRGDIDPVAAVAIVIDLVGQLARLPGQPRLIETPGSYSGPSAKAAPSSSGEIDAKVLARVRALLAKAESTEFSEEAELFFAKAQELMSRYSLERAVVDAVGEAGAAIQTGGRRVWLDNPYLSPKSMVVNAVATANRCRAVFLKDLGFVTVVGEETDTEIVEMLATSLLVHASRSMLAEGSRQGSERQSRPRSFRQAFLVAYAQRISERLSEAAAHAQDDVASSLADGGGGAGQLVPVLAARDEAVAVRMAEYFPRVVTRRVSVSNSAGWAAGRAAADLANLNVRKAVR
jgi:hypothetical protein